MAVAVMATGIDAPRRLSMSVITTTQAKVCNARRRHPPTWHTTKTPHSTFLHKEEERVPKRCGVDGCDGGNNGEGEGERVGTDG